MLSQVDFTSGSVANIIYNNPITSGWLGCLAIEVRAESDVFSLSFHKNHLS